MRLLQLANTTGDRLVCRVDNDRLWLIDRYSSVYDLAHAALGSGVPVAEIVENHLTRDEIGYDEIYAGRSEWHILPPIDHPVEPARCLVSGTGLTHKGSADNRQAMHSADAAVTDSMRMFQWGLEGGRPEPGRIGVSPEWFYKGNGSILRAHGEPLDIPAYAEDGGEEAEIAGVYLIDGDGRPRRLGMTAGNEFSDHRFEKRNYLYLAASKLHNCSLGPEIVLDPDFSSVSGEVSIERQGQVIWSKAILTGDAAMSHSLENIEHHHFKTAAHRRPGDLHVHFFGAAALSFGDGIELLDGDVMQVRFDGFGRPLRNPLRRSGEVDKLIQVVPF